MKRKKESNRNVDESRKDDTPEPNEWWKGLTYEQQLAVLENPDGKTGMSPRIRRCWIRALRELGGAYTGKEPLRLRLVTTAEQARGMRPMPSQPQRPFEADYPWMFEDDDPRSKDTKH